ncbi:MAG: DUF3604 domain-containing protein [Candidatus Solibacter usitatus]|nr:DUF3604 domain-containing protein [Candidatus Solibacter usitatus]
MTRTITVIIFCALVLWLAMPQQRVPVAIQGSDASVALRVTFGERRSGTLSYDGSVAARGGRVLRLRPWRFFENDAILSTTSWKLTIKRGPMENQPDRPVMLADGAVVPRTFVPAGLFVSVSSGTESLDFQTAQGTFSVGVGGLAFGAPLTFLRGDVRVERVPDSFRVSTAAEEEHDYPSFCVTRGGGTWLLWQAYRNNGDHIYARSPDGAIARVTPEKADVFRSAVAEDEAGRIHVMWAERQESHWELQERIWQNGVWGPKRKGPSAGTPNFYHKLIASKDGALQLIWVGHEGGKSFLYHSSLRNGQWTSARQIGGPSVWSPDAAIDAQGNLHVSWDSYAKGNYDINYRVVSRSGELGAIEMVTKSPLFEAHASITIDGEGRPWLAWDESGSNWGKDFNHADQNRATTLYANRGVRVAVRHNGTWMQAGEFATAVPERIARYAQLPKLAADSSGRVWALFQIRTSAESTHDDVWATGGLWDLYLTSFDGREWLPASMIPDSSTRPEAPFELKAAGSGVSLAWATGGRSYSGKSGNHEHPTMSHYDIYTASASARAVSGRVQLSELTEPVVRQQTIHLDERGDVARIRAYRSIVQNAEYRIVRGDFHRHTEISFDGAGDGSLEDYYRYMLDGADMDTGIMGDHNMGGDMEYNWWRTEKSYDLFHIPGRFTPLFGYERSVRFPNGHRNVIFDHRGVRTLPISPQENQGVVNSGGILYPYLRQNRGICMEHSLATNQGTDYRDNDPDLEPLVEIYQGYHASYEYAGAPRAESESSRLTMHGPLQPAGFWWNALAKGLKLGVHASSDHISTHCS